MSTVDNILANMRRAGKMSDNKAKGDLGEDAVLSICYERLQRVGNGLLYQSYTYPYQTNDDGVCYTGNIKYENGVFTDYTRDTLSDEIDVLYITPYRIFPIEVKSYGNTRLDIYDHWFNRGATPVDKSPITQAEKHARHLYHALYDVLPDGKPEYVVPLLCFVDKCTVRDDRSPHFKEYIPVCILNNLKATIAYRNKPLEYNLAIADIKEKLNQIGTARRQFNE